MAVNATHSAELSALADDSATLTLAIVVLLFVGAFFAAWLVVGLTLCRDGYLVRHLHSSVSSYFSYTKYHRYGFFVILIILLCILSMLSAGLVWEYRRNTTENAVADNISLGAELCFSALTLLLLFPVKAVKNGQSSCCASTNTKASYILHMIGGLAVLILFPALECIIYSYAIGLGKDKWTNVAVVVASSVQIMLALVFFGMMAFDMGCFKCYKFPKGYRRGNGSREDSQHNRGTSDNTPLQPLAAAACMPLNKENYADVDDLRYLGPANPGEPDSLLIFAVIEENPPCTARFYLWKVWVEYVLILLNVVATALLNLKKIALFDVAD
jgi:hypothetical protein